MIASPNGFFCETDFLPILYQSLPLFDFLQRNFVSSRNFLTAEDGFVLKMQNGAGFEWELEHRDVVFGFQLYRDFFHCFYNGNPLLQKRPRNRFNITRIKIAGDSGVVATSRHFLVLSSLGKICRGEKFNRIVKMKG